MKRLILVRHAKSEQLQDKFEDFDRNLSIIGEEDAKIISERLKKDNIIPDVVISSKANRAIQTAKIFCENIFSDNNNNNIKTINSLYNSYTTTDFIDLIISQSDNKNSIMVVAHNPGIGNMAHSLLDNFIYSTPTCTVIVIDFNVDSWKNIEVRTGELSYYKTPQNM